MRRSAPLRRQLRQLARACFREGILEQRFVRSTILLTLEPFFGATALFRQQARLRAAYRRAHQAAWLFMKQREMEDRLEALRLPRDAWRQGFDHAIWNEEPEPTERLWYIVNASEHARPAVLWRWLQAVDGPASWAGYCTAYAAWLAHWARAVRSPEMRLRFGRVLTACEANLSFPDRERSEIVQRGRKGGHARRGKVAPQTAFIRTAMIEASTPTLSGVLALLCDECAVDDLFRAIKIPLPFVTVEVDEPAQKIEFKDARDDVVHSMSFTGLEKAIERSSKPASDR